MTYYVITSRGDPEHVLGVTTSNSAAKRMLQKGYSVFGATDAKYLLNENFFVCFNERGSCICATKKWQGESKWVTVSRRGGVMFCADDTGARYIAVWVTAPNADEAKRIARQKVASARKSDGHDPWKPSSFSSDTSDIIDSWVKWAKAMQARLDREASS